MYVFVFMLVYHFYLLTILFVFARIRQFTTRAFSKYNGRFMCSVHFPLGLSLYIFIRHIHTIANARRSHIPMPSSIYSHTLDLISFFCTFAVNNRFTRIGSGKIIKFNASNRKSRGYLFWTHGAERRSLNVFFY